jgi:hypothetical protein
VGRMSRNEAAFSCGVVGYGVGWVWGRSLVVARVMVVEIGGGFQGGRGRCIRKNALALACARLSQSVTETLSDSSRL